MKLILVVLPCILLISEPLRAQSRAEGSAVSEEVTYFNEETRLAAALSIPPGSGPFPGVVLVHGSGSSDRSNPWTSAYAAALLERGIAVLHPDKRGSGASGGDWQKATISELADDALAGLTALRNHPRVDSARAGLIGFSQGGHIVPLAAARSPDVAFVVNVSGSVVPMMEQIGDEIRKMGEREGLKESDLEIIQSIHEHAVRYALRGEGWEIYLATLEEARAEHPGAADVIEGFPIDSDAPAWQHLRAIGDFDPLPYWTELEVPALFIYGGRDENVDVFKSARIIEENLTRSGLSYSLLLFRNNGHALFREDACDFVARWIRDGGVD